MRKPLIILTAFVFLAACQSTTASHQSPRNAAPALTASCSAADRSELAGLNQKIGDLQKVEARGYRSENGPVKIKNPLKLCKGFGPIAKVCLPTPEPTSTLPSYEEYKANRAELETLKERRKAILQRCPAA